MTDNQTDLNIIHARLDRLQTIIGEELTLAHADIESAYLDCPEPPIEPPVEPPIDPPIDPPADIPPTGYVARRGYLLGLPPDSERGITKILQPGNITRDLTDAPDGTKFGLRTGVAYTHNAPDIFVDDLWITAVGDRDKPLPHLVSTRARNIRMHGHKPTWELFEISNPMQGPLLRFDECSDSVLRYVVGHDAGVERTPGTQNRGIAFVTSNSRPGAIHRWTDIEAYDIAEDAYQSLTGDEQAEMHMTNLYGHECYEDLVDNKSLKKFVGRNLYGKNLGSKGFVGHGTSGEWDVGDFYLENMALNDGIYIDGKGRTLIGPWTFARGRIINAKGWAGIFKDAAGIARFTDVVLIHNERGNEIHKGRNTGNLIIR